VCGNASLWAYWIHCFHMHLSLLFLFSPSVMSNSLWSHRLQQARFLCPSLYPWVCSNWCPSSQWCPSNHLILCCPLLLLQSFPASGSFPMSQLFKSGGQNIGASASASVLPMNIQGWFPLGLTVLLSLMSKGLSKVFSSTNSLKAPNLQDQAFLKV